MGALWPAVVGILIGLPSAALGYLAYRRGMRADAVAAKATIAVVESGNVASAIDGLNRLVDQLQEELNRCIARVRELEARRA